MTTYPFSTPNRRVFYACVGVVANRTGSYFGRNTEDATEAITDGVFIPGVQSVGVSGDTPASSLLDVGRFQRSFTYYGKQSFEITIERVLDRDSRPFFCIDDSNYTGTYTDSHILKADHLGVQGFKDSNDKTLKNYDITIIYGSENFDRLGSGNHQTPASTHPDKDKAFSVTYRQCLLTSVSYSMNVGEPIRETITLIANRATYDIGTSISSFNLPVSASAQSGTTLKYYDLDINGGGAAQVPSLNINSVLPEEVQRYFKARNSSNQVDYEAVDGVDREIIGLTSISLDINIEYSEIIDVGRWRDGVEKDKTNINRYVTLPVQVSSTFTGNLRQPLPQRIPPPTPTDYLEYTDTTFSKADGVRSSTEWNRVDREVKLVASFPTSSSTGTYFVWDLGKRNYMTSFSQDGAGADGGNMEGTMSFQNDYSDAIIAKVSGGNSAVKDITYPSQPF
tara:strand:+ start:1245 stop:2597 length:1353 start_codon:yes stop_codon:yes gene_type:complete